VAYVDIDPIVLSHLRGLPSREQVGLTIVDGDVRDADAVLAVISAGLDLSRAHLPGHGRATALLPGRDRALRWSRGTRRPLAPGSYVMLTMGLADGQAADRFFDCTARARPPCTSTRRRTSRPSSATSRCSRPAWRTRDPGVQAGQWCRYRPKRAAEMIVGVAQVP